MAGRSATFITMGPHPLYPSLAMVVWLLEDSRPRSQKFGRVSIDALSYGQDVGGVDPEQNSNQQCFDRLREALKAV